LATDMLAGQSKAL